MKDKGDVSYQIWREGTFNSLSTPTAIVNYSGIRCQYKHVIVHVDMFAYMASW